MFVGIGRIAETAFRIPDSFDENEDSTDVVGEAAMWTIKIINESPPREELRKDEFTYYIFCLPICHVFLSSPLDRIR